MPWVKLDDRFATHRKVELLSDRAFRLHVSALCWVSANLTEGKILDSELSVISRIRNKAAAVKELAERGLWDRADGGWEIHDYLVYNPDRAQADAEREANAARQQAFRDRKKAEREAKKAAAEEAARNGARNAVTHAPPEAENSTTTTATRHDGDTNAHESDLANQSSSQVAEIRNAVSNGTPNPTRPVVPPLEEQQLQLVGQMGALASIGDRPRIPRASQPLVDKLMAAGLVVTWDLQPTEWFTIEALIKRCGVDALVISARGSWQGATKQPRAATYFMPAWRKVPDSVPPAEPSYLPEAVGDVRTLPNPNQHRPATTDLRAAAGPEVGRRLQALADARRAQQENQ